ncbi:MAG: SDR family NAD(P)-dependent oxidoreductase [Actinomycetota bacterium]|jgi:NAD(P)-dependent dehydrogenase (short-subunit alcohol dehydrogenase family)|nr:SDR family NAD(P)-dependent oxidoreductase [Actinomycetota bacterium]
MRLQDQAVLVTGAGGTIGREVCRLLAEHGALLAMTDVNTTSLEATAAEIDPLARKSLARPLDATSVDALEGFLADAESTLGAVGVLVNVAGSFVIEEFETSTPQQWDAMISANLETTLVACRVCLPPMLSRGAGSIVNFASTAGEYGSIRPSAVYAAAKAGVIGFTKSLAREVSPRGVRVNAISPGPIDTPALMAASPQDRAATADRTLLGRIGAPADIAYGVLYLASDESAFVTGTVLQVNGGSLL